MTIPSKTYPMTPLTPTTSAANSVPPNLITPNVKSYKLSGEATISAAPSLPQKIKDFFTDTSGELKNQIKPSSILGISPLSGFTVPESLVNLPGKAMEKTGLPKTIGKITETAVGKPIGMAVGSIGEGLRQLIDPKIIAAKKLDIGKIAESALKTAESTGQFGKEIGEGGTIASAYAPFGRIPQAMMTAPLIKGGVEKLKNGDIEGGTQELAIGLLSLRGAVKSKGSWIEPGFTQGLSKLKNKKFPGLSVTDVGKEKMNEAKKYPTAEEFIKAQGTPVYHQTKESFTSFAPTSHGSYGEHSYFYFSNKPNIVEKMIKGGASKDVSLPTKKITAYLDVKNPLDLTGVKSATLKDWEKILKDRGVNIPKEKLDRMRSADLQRMKRVPWQIFRRDSGPMRKSLLDAGYDGIKWKEWGGETTVALSPEQIKTKSQLIDIWKRAQEGIKGADKSSEISDDLLAEARKYKSAEEWVGDKNVDKNLLKIYNELYGEKNNTIDKFGETAQGAKVRRVDGRRTIGNFPADSRPNIRGIVKQINDNPEGFTINLNGDKISDGFVVSPYKGRETIIDKVNAESVRNFILKNTDLLMQDGNYFGGWNNSKDGKFYLDVSIVKNDLIETIGIAVKNNQLGIYDIKKGKTIFTTDHLKSRLSDIWNEAQGETSKMPEKIQTKNYIRDGIDLSDTKFKFKQEDLPEIIERGIEDNNGWTRRAVKLSEMINNDNLFKKFPELKDIKLGYGKPKSKFFDQTTAYFDPANKKIVIYTKDAEGYPADVRGSIIHELQHYIQGVKENTMGAGRELTVTEKSMLKKLNDEASNALVKNDHAKVKKIWEEIYKIQDKANGTNAYLNHPLEKEAYEASNDFFIKNIHKQTKNNIQSIAEEVNKVLPKKIRNFGESIKQISKEKYPSLTDDEVKKIGEIIGSLSKPSGKGGASSDFYGGIKKETSLSASPMSAPPAKISSVAVSKFSPIPVKNAAISAAKPSLSASPVKNESISASVSTMPKTTGISASPNYSAMSDDEFFANVPVINAGKNNSILDSIIYKSPVSGLGLANIFREKYLEPESEYLIGGVKKAVDYGKELVNNPVQTIKNIPDLIKSKMPKLAKSIPSMVMGATGTLTDVGSPVMQSAAQLVKRDFINQLNFQGKTDLANAVSDLDIGGISDYKGVADKIRNSLKLDADSLGRLESSVKTAGQMIAGGISNAFDTGKKLMQGANAGTSSANNIRSLIQTYKNSLNLPGISEGAREIAREEILSLQNLLSTLVK